MTVGNIDMGALAEGLSQLLSQVRLYRQTTVELLNNGVEDDSAALERRQGLVGEIKAADERIGRLLSISGGGIARLSQTVKALANPGKGIDGVLALAEQLQTAIRDAMVLDRKLLIKTQKQRGELVRDIKSIADRRKVVDASYFAGRSDAVGKAYDRKK